MKFLRKGLLVLIATGALLSPRPPEQAFPELDFVRSQVRTGVFSDTFSPNPKDPYAPLCWRESPGTISCFAFGGISYEAVLSPSGKLEVTSLFPTQIARKCRYDAQGALTESLMFNNQTMAQEAYPENYPQRYAEFDCERQVSDFARFLRRLLHY